MGSRVVVDNLGLLLGGLGVVSKGFLRVKIGL